MKGISAVIAIVMILMITIALSAMAYIWFTEMFVEVSDAGTQEFEQTSQTMASDFMIESVKGSTVYIRNIGENNITDLNLFIDEEEVEFTSNFDVIEPSDIGKIEINPDNLYGKDEIVITTSGGLHKNKKIDVEFDSSFDIQSVVGSVILINNTGDVNISDFDIYLDNEPVFYQTNFTEKLSPGSVGEITLQIGSNYGEKELKIETNTEVVEVENHYIDDCKNEDVVLCYRFDEGSGVEVNDSSSAGIDAEILGGGTWVDGISGKAVYFDGVDDVISMSDNVTLSRESATLSFWVKYDNPAEGRGLFTYRYYGSTINLISFWIDRWYAETSVNCNTFNFNSLTQTTDWRYYTLVFNQSKAYLYIDGEYFSEAIYGRNGCSGEVAYQLMGDFKFCYVGARSYYTDPRANYKGIIDEVRIYDKPLTAEEISFLYNTTL